MFEDELYITIAGINHYLGMRPFRIGTLLTLQKEPDNGYDSEAIMVSMPVVGRVGYVANSHYTVAQGCISAGRLYDKMPDECVAVVRFITASKVIALVIPEKKLNVKVEMTLEDTGQPAFDTLLSQLFERKVEKH